MAVKQQSESQNLLKHLNTLSSHRFSHGLGVDQSSNKTGMELLQGAGFCDVSWQFTPAPDGPWEE